ncbi:putative AC transposase, partial [Pseudolycoriella hygida]
MAKPKTLAGSNNGPDDLESIKNCDLVVKLTKSSTKAKSLAWSYFGSLHFKETDKPVGSKKNKYMCNVCFKESDQFRLFNESDIKAFSTNISTTSLLNHVEKDHKISFSSKSVEESTKSLHDYFATERTVPSSNKTVVKFILILDGQGLRDFLEKYKVSAVDDLPHRTSISRALTTVYTDCKSWLVDHIRSNCPATVAVTFDGWSDKYRRRNYVTLTLHYVNKFYELINLTLSTSHFPDRHQAKATCNLGSYENISCVGHALHNLVNVDGFRQTESLNGLVKKVKNIVKALRYRTDEFEKLTKDQVCENDKMKAGCHTSLKMDVETRWYSVLIMMESLIAYNKNVINVMLLNTENSHLALVNNDVLLLKELVALLKQFQRITAIFSGEQYATLNYYTVFRSEIYSLLESEPQDSLEIKMMKANMMAKFDHRFPLSDIVVLASLLDPRFQNLLDIKNYLQSNKLTAVDFLVKCAGDIFSDGISSSPNTSSGSTSKSESFIDELAEKHSTLGSVGRTSTSQTALERECYLLLSMHNKIKITNVLTFWKDHA